MFQRKILTIVCRTLLATGIGWVFVLVLLILEGFANLTRLIGFGQALQVYMDPIDEQLWFKLVIAGMPGIILVGLSVILRRRYLGVSGVRPRGDDELSSISSS